MVEPTFNLEEFSHEPCEGRSSSGCGSCGSGLAIGSDAARRESNGRPTTAVRFGYMRFIGEFVYSSDLKFTCGGKVVIQTRRGIEIGSQVSLTCSGCDKSVPRNVLKTWVKQNGEDTYLFDSGRILREATAADLAEYARIQSSCAEKRGLAQQTANRHGLALRVAECECTFGGERIIFYFTAEERVDFRGLVKDLATEYRTRIEMRQIGARDEARLLADFETCGREICCKAHLKTLRKVSMRMAKLQKATLDPSQVSGRCGRLKCCLRYEHVGYEELDKQLPRNGVRIRTTEGEGVVFNRQILTQLVQFRDDQGVVKGVAIEEITEVDVPPPPPGEDPNPQEARRGRPEKPTGRRERPARPQVRQKPQGERDAPAKPAPEEPQAQQKPADKVDGNVKPSRRRRRRRGRRSSGQGDSGGNKGGAPPSP